jgi:hypothetical protein
MRFIDVWNSISSVDDEDQKDPDPVDEEVILPAGFF